MPHPLENLCAPLLVWSRRANLFDFSELTELETTSADGQASLSSLCDELCRVRRIGRRHAFGIALITSQDRRKLVFERAIHGRATLEKRVDQLEGELSGAVMRVDCAWGNHSLALKCRHLRAGDTMAP